MTQRYDTPQEGTLDWHIPLNENFQRLDRDVEIRDAAANRSNYDPQSGAKFLATDTYDVYLGDGGSWNKVGNLADGDSGSTSGSGTSLSEALAAGNVVAVGDGFERRVDRAASATPVQDAIDILTANEGSGRVYLPPGKTRDNGPISIPSGAQGIHIQGTGISTDATNARNCVVEITGSNPGMDVIGWGWKYASMDDFTLRGTGQNYPAVRFRQEEQFLTPRMFNIGRLRLNNWDAAPRGVFHYDNSETFSCHYDTLMFSGQNTGPCIEFEDSSPLMLKITNMYADHNSRYPVIKNRTEAPGLYVDMCNVGGEHTGVLDLTSMTQLGFVHMGTVNYEPSQAMSTGTVHRLNGPGYCHLPHTAVTGFGGSIELEQVIELGGNNGNNMIGQIQIKGDTTINNNLINVTKKPRDPTYFFGASSDVQNSAGSSTGRVRALRSAGSGNA